MRYTKFQKILTLAMALLMLLSLSACKGKDETQKDDENIPKENKDESDPLPRPVALLDIPADKPDNKGDNNPNSLGYPDNVNVDTTYDYYIFDPDTLVEYTGIVEHIFFRPVIAYPELAFDGDAKEAGLDDWMVTIPEFNKILNSLYEKGYILVDINDVWSEYQTNSGSFRMKRNTLMVPEGRKPLIVSIDDPNYYEYMIENGFTYKLIIGEDGELWSWGLDPEGNEVVSQDLDIITIMNKFIEEHPDFSLNGAKACLSVTGYEGLFGYRTNTDTKSWTAEQEANRQKEIEAVKPIIAKLKATGWTFGCHTWGHINLQNKGLETVKVDMTRWMNEVGTLIGETSIMFYPFGGRPDGQDVWSTGPVLKYFQELGFRVFCSVGIESFSYIKPDISAVCCDRLHPDGTTLRWSRNRYLKFYDAKDVFDYDVRPDYGYDFS